MSRGTQKTKKYQMETKKQDSTSSKKFLSRCKSFFIQNEKEIVFFVALILLSVFSFEIGMIKGQGTASGTLVIEKPIEKLVIQEDSSVDQNTAQAPQETAQVAGVETSSQESAEKCLFVGSKNSDKYHSPSCHWAKRIKPENIVCFGSKDAAKKQGYVEGCIK